MHTGRFFSFIHVLRNIRPNIICCVGMRDDVLLFPKLEQLFCLWTRLWIALVLGGQLLSIFTFNETTWSYIVVQSNPVGVELFSRVNTFVGYQCYKFCAQKPRPAKWNYTFPPLIYPTGSSVGFLWPLLIFNLRIPGLMWPGKQILLIIRQLIA